ncbi:MAG: TFIIB-type zinc ribbon-containing protein, partial [Halohasta sp.]
MSETTIRTYVRGNEQSQERTEERAADETHTCPECSGRLLTDSEHGETVCQDCGLVVEEDAVDRGPEWRAFDS